MNEQSAFYKEGNQGSKKGLCDLPKGTRLAVGLSQGPLLSPRPGLTPLQAAVSAKVPSILAALQPGWRKGLPCLVWKNRAKAMATGCLGAEPDSHAGAEVLRALCLLSHA